MSTTRPLQAGCSEDVQCIADAVQGNFFPLAAQFAGKIVYKVINMLRVVYIKEIFEIYR